MNKNVTKNIVLAAVLFLFGSATALAQYYDIGSEKSSVKWKTMKSRNFEIVYPAGMGANAASYLNKVESLYGIYSDSVRYNYGLPKRFPMVLHPFNAESNGVTVWGPRQIDFFAQPPVNLISTEPWDLSLASHEGRHAWQIAHFNRGIFKVLSWGFGDQVVGAASAIYPSRWFLEGDAVVAETQMSNGGRGRSGFFLCEILKTIVEDEEDGHKYFYGKNRSWDRYRFGSVKAYSPDRYSVGYMINAMARHHSGDVDLSHKILNYETNHFMSANVVASAFKEFTGKTHRQYVKDSLLKEFLRLNTNGELEEFLDNIEDDSASERLVFDPVKRTGESNGYFTEYSNVTVVGKDSLVAVVSGTGTPGLLVLLTREADAGQSYAEGWKEKVIRPYYEGAEKFCYYGNRLWTSECNEDARWKQHSSYSIYGYDLNTGVAEDEFCDEENNSLHLPFVVEYGSRPLLCCIQYGTDHNTSIIRSLAFLDDGSPSEDIRINIQGQINSITSYGSDIWYSMVGDGGMEIGKVSSGRPVSVYKTVHTVKDLQCHDGGVYFLTDMFSCPVICRLDASSGEITLASASEDVCSFGIAESGKIFVSKDSKDKGAFLHCDKLLSLPVSPKMEFTNPMAAELTRQYREKYGKRVEDYSAAIGDNSGNFKEEDYSKAGHLFRLHSWAPVYAEFSGVTEGDFEEFYEEALPGVTLYSQNTLGTLRATAGYAYQHRNGFLGASKHLHSGHASFSWSGWYPVIEGEFHFNDRIMYKKDRFSVRSSLYAYVPLSWSGTGWNSGVTPLAGWSFRNDQIILDVKEAEPSTAASDDDDEPDYTYTLKQINRHQLNFSLGAYDMQEMAESQVFPRWGIGGRVAASFSPEGGDRFGSQFSAYAYGYVPGLVFNHGLRLSAGFQRQNVEGKKFWLDNHLDLPRGFTEDFYGRNMIRATADYAIPIYLGDVSIGPLAYLQQLQVIPFIDYSRVDFYRRTGGLMGFYTGTHYQWEDRYSFGADVMLRGHFLRIGFPMYIGVRYARTNKPCDYGNATPATYGGSGGRNFCTLLLGIEFY